MLIAPICKISPKRETLVYYNCQLANLQYC